MALRNQFEELVGTAKTNYQKILEMENKSDALAEHAQQFAEAARELRLKMGGKDEAKGENQLKYEGLKLHLDMLMKQYKTEHKTTHQGAVARLSKELTVHHRKETKKRWPRGEETILIPPDEDAYNTGINKFRGLLYGSEIYQGKSKLSYAEIERDLISLGNKIKKELPAAPTQTLRQTSSAPVTSTTSSSSSASASANVRAIQSAPPAVDEVKKSPVEALAGELVKELKTRVTHVRDLLAQRELKSILDDNTYKTDQKKLKNFFKALRKYPVRDHYQQLGILNRIDDYHKVGCTVDTRVYEVPTISASPKENRGPTVTTGATRRKDEQQTSSSTASATRSPRGQAIPNIDALLSRADALEEKTAEMKRGGVPLPAIATILPAFQTKPAAAGETKASESLVAEIKQGINREITRLTDKYKKYTLTKESAQLNEEERNAIRTYQAELTAYRTGKSKNKPIPLSQEMIVKQRLQILYGAQETLAGIDIQDGTKARLTNISHDSLLEDLLKPLQKSMLSTGNWFESERTTTGSYSNSPAAAWYNPLGWFAVTGKNNIQGLIDKVKEEKQEQTPKPTP